jgi:hypothetical protein
MDILKNKGWLGCEKYSIAQLTRDYIKSAHKKGTSDEIRLLVLHEPTIQDIFDGKVYIKKFDPVTKEPIFYFGDEALEVHSECLKNQIRNLDPSLDSLRDQIEVGKMLFE